MIHRLKKKLEAEWIRSLTLKWSLSRNHSWWWNEPLFLLSGNRISEYVIKLGLSQAIEQYDNWFEFFVEVYFCLEVFQSRVLL